MNQQQVDPRVLANMVASTTRKEELMSSINSIVDESKHLKELTFRLKGYEYKTINNKVQKVQYHKPMLSESGADEIISYYSGILTKNVILSWFKENQINILCKQFDYGLLDELTVNINNYGISSGENLQKIWRLISVNHQAVLNRAFKGLTLITALKNIAVHEVRRLDEPNEQTKGIARVFRK